MCTRLIECVCDKYEHHRINSNNIIEAAAKNISKTQNLTFVTKKTLRVLFEI
jgi:hypothetical protein